MSTLTVRTPRVLGNRHEVDVAGSTLWFEFDGPLIPERAHISAAAVALLPHAMANFDGLYLAGEVDRDLLANLEEFRDYWSMWLPGRLKRIEISVDRLVDRPAGAREAIAAFSGGVDSTYQLVANVEQLLGARSLPVRAAVLIHGFDVPVDDAPGFSRAVNHARPVLDELGVTVMTVRTNWREFCPDWEMCFGAGVASVLHHFADVAGYGLMAADEQYNLEVLPWGSNSTSNRAQLGYLHEIAGNDLPPDLARAVRRAIRANEVRERVRPARRAWRGARRRLSRWRAGLH